MFGAYLLLGPKAPASLADDALPLLDFRPWNVVRTAPQTGEPSPAT